REARGDAEGDRLEGRARTRVAVTARRVPQRGVKRATEIEGAKGGDERTPRERVVDAVARAAERLGQRRARTHRTFGGAKQPRSRAPRAPPRVVGAEARGERRQRRADGEADDGQHADGKRERGERRGGCRAHALPLPERTRPPGLAESAGVRVRRARGSRGRRAGRHARERRARSRRSPERRGGRSPPARPLPRVRAAAPTGRERRPPNPRATW